MKHSERILAQHGIVRSSKWAGVRKKWLRKHPLCAECGEATNVEVHHTLPFHYCVAIGRPDLELDDRNLCTLGEKKGTNHHLNKGHLYNWKLFEPRFVEDPPPPELTRLSRIELTHMRLDDLKSLRAYVDKRFPLSVKTA